MRMFVRMTIRMIVRMIVCNNGTAHFKNVNKCCNTSICFYLETSGGQDFNLCLNVVNFFNNNVN